MAGIFTFSDTGLVQVRNTYENPNYVQIWMLWEVGMLVKNLHKRGLMMSDGIATANQAPLLTDKLNEVLVK